MTYQQFLADYYTLISDPNIGKTYRLGQHFINLFIKDSSSHRMQCLWNETRIKIAEFGICDYIEEMQWDYEDLPLLGMEK